IEFPDDDDEPSVRISDEGRFYFTNPDPQGVINFTDATIGERIRIKGDGQTVLCDADDLTSAACNGATGVKIATTSNRDLLLANGVEYEFVLDTGDVWRQLGGIAPTETVEVCEDYPV